MKQTYPASHHLPFFKTHPTRLWVCAWAMLLLGLLPASAQVTNDSIVGNNNMTSSNTGVAVNGNTNGAVNNNQNNLSTGSNVNNNTVNPVVIAPSSQQYSGVHGGNGYSSGGAAALVLPRNPLPLPNAMYGRSNFGLQFGVQNNPGLNSLSGGKDELGFFLQGGLTIPFGKIPNVNTSPESRRLDDMRRSDIENDRMIFRDPLYDRRRSEVRGRVVDLNAYNYSTTPSGKLLAPASAQATLTPSLPGALSSPFTPQPKVLALAQAQVFTQPLNTGRQIGLVEVGREYPYLGHTRQGWVKILLPNGQQGWTSTHFEYIKMDYTEIDDLAVARPADSLKRAATTSHRETTVKKRRS